MCDPAWENFVRSLDPVKVSQEWAPPLGRVEHERPGLEDSGRERVKSVQEWGHAMAADRRLQAALADIERVAEQRAWRERVRRNYQIEITKRKAA